MAELLLLCFCSGLLSILGVILFLRLGWAVGEAGLYGVLGVFLLAETQAILTVLSLSALVSNGKMAGGGPYFLISRALGPEIGGAIGVLFYCACTSPPTQPRRCLLSSDLCWFRCCRCRLLHHRMRHRDCLDLFRRRRHESLASHDHVEFDSLRHTRHFVGRRPFLCTDERQRLSYRVLMRYHFFADKYQFASLPCSVWSHVVSAL